MAKWRVCFGRSSCLVSQCEKRTVHGAVRITHECQALDPSGPPSNQYEPMILVKIMGKMSVVSGQFVRQSDSQRLPKPPDRVELHTQ